MHLPKVISGWRPVPGERQAQQLSRPLATLPPPHADTKGGSGAGDGAGSADASTGEPEVMLTWVVRLRQGGDSVDFLWCPTQSRESHGTGCDHECGPDVAPPPSPMPSRQPPLSPPTSLPSQSSAAAESRSLPTPSRRPTPPPVHLVMHPPSPSLSPSGRPHTAQLLTSLAIGSALLAALAKLALITARARMQSQISDEPEVSRTTSKHDGAGAIRGTIGFRWVRPLKSFRSRHRGWRPFSDESNEGAELSHAQAGGQCRAAGGAIARKAEGAGELPITI